LPLKIYPTPHLGVWRLWDRSHDEIYANFHTQTKQSE
jgi:hypothetical protein